MDVLLTYFIGNGLVSNGEANTKKLVENVFIAKVNK